MSSWSVKLKTYRAACREASEATKRAEALRLKLVAICPHPSDEIRDYQWHHGYGKYITGSQCGVCNARKSFKDQARWAPYSEWSEYKRDWADD
jgi:hypothetical protein